MSVALDSVMETQVAQLNLLLYQIYRPYFNADPESVGGDTLTCGVCRKEFALADIVKFIQHKVLTCNKENYNADSKKSVAATENGGSTDNVISSENEANALETSTTTLVTTSASDTPPTSSTLTRRHSISTTTEVKSLSSSAASPADKVKTELEQPLRKKTLCMDAESNTVNSGKQEASLSILHLLQCMKIVCESHDASSS